MENIFVSIVIFVFVIRGSWCVLRVDVYSETEISFLSVCYVIVRGFIVLCVGITERFILTIVWLSGKNLYI